MTRNIEATVGNSRVASCQPAPFGRPSGGRPAGTGPRIATPCDCRSNPQLTAIVTTTATRPAGITLAHLPKATSVATTATDTASVVSDVAEMSCSVFQNLTIVPAVRPGSTVGGGM